MTLADDIKDIITTYYGALGGGGTPPSVIENVVDLPADHQPSVEQILVWIPRPAVRDPITTDFAKVTYTVAVRMVTSASDDRLEIIANEVRRVIGTNAVPGMDSQEVSGEIDLSNRFSQIFMMEFEITLIDDLAANTLAYGGEKCVDDDAIHDNVDGEIHVISPKGTPVSADEIIIEDSADSWAKKRVALTDLLGGGNGGGPGSGTQWTLPVWDTVSTLGDSMVSQNAGGTQLDVDGDLYINDGGFYVLWTGAGAWSGIECPVNDGNPSFFIGATGSDDFYLQVVYNTGTQVLDRIELLTTSTGTGDDGKIVFRPDSTTALTINPDTTSVFVGDVTVPNLITAGTVDGVDISDHDGGDVETYHTNFYSDTDTEAVITAELVDGQSIDVAIDSLISTHASDDNAHHEVFEAGDFTTAFAAEDFNNLATTAHVLASADHTVSGLTAGDILSADTATTYSWKANPGGADADAIHDNVDDEIHQIALKGTPASADELVIEDSAASWAKKRIAISTLPAGSPAFGAPTGDIDIGDAAVEGTSGDSTRADHQHAFSAPGAGYPLDVALAEDDGTATTPARSDHVHAHGSGYAADAHHTKYLDSDTEAVITAELVDGQSIDNAIDALISTHASDDNAHHEVFEAADFTTAFAAESLANLTTRTHASLSDAPEDAHHPRSHALDSGSDHSGTLPVADIVNGTEFQILKAGASNPAWADEIFSKGGNVMSPATGYYLTWVADFACTVTKIYGIQKGGTSTVVNARIDGTDQVATSDLTLTAADTVYSTASLSNSTVVAGDHIEIEVVTVGSATQILIQLEFTRP